MRELTSHKVNGLNEALEIQVLDEPGQGNACHNYVIKADDVACSVHFQNGPIAEAGVNGISNAGRSWCLAEDPDDGEQGSEPTECEP